MSLGPGPAHVHDRARIFAPRWVKPAAGPSLGGSSATAHTHIKKGIIRLMKPH